MTNCLLWMTSYEGRVSAMSHYRCRLPCIGETAFGFDHLPASTDHRVCSPGLFFVVWP